MGGVIYRNRAPTQDLSARLSPVADAFAIIRPMKRPRRPRSRYLSVSLAHVELWRGGRRVLHELSWRIRPGQHWVLQGANGAGKTQLLKLIAGDVWPQPLPRTQRAYHWRGERSFEPQGVKEEIAYLGAERQDRYEHYRWNFPVAELVGTGLARSDVPLRALTATERIRVARVLRRLGIEALAQRRFLALSQGERRLVLLARALASRPALLLLDEPLNGLDAANRARVLAALVKLGRSGLPWVYATHRLEEAPAGVTHHALLHDGRVRTQRWRRGAVARANDAPAAAVDSSRSAAPSNSALAPTLVRAPRARAALLGLQNATVWRGGVAVLRHLSLQVCPGDCWVVHGANGSGKSTLLATLHGDLAVASAGRILRPGRPSGTLLHQFQRRIGRVSPELQAALPRALTAQECVVAGLRGAFGLDGAPRPAECRAAAAALRRAGALRQARRAFGDLSYGQARRVLFARALAAHPDIVLLDEPYTGLDAPTRTRLRALVDRLCAMEQAIVIATHHSDDWPRQATHELELRSGRVVYCGTVRRHGASGGRGR
jgi:molybdate transport system ATP-binding protein